VTDVYIYYFLERDRTTGESKLSTRPATLRAIRGKGKAVMESQLVVDHTELDGDGFLITGGGDGSFPADDVTAEINSMELRAASRDSEALKLNDASEGKDKYMLSLESRELRGQARRLRIQQKDSRAGDLRSHGDASAAAQFRWHPTAE
jgi:hypothetical protein